MNEILLHQAKPSDYPSIIAVIDQWWGGRQMAAMLPKLFFVHFQPTSFVAEHKDEIVGFVTGFVSQTFSDEAYIHFVGVHPAFRKIGLARTLYQKFFDTVMNLGCRTVRCVTSPLNKASISFHRHMGFCVTDSAKMIDDTPVVEDYDGKGEHRVLFYKVLS